jgi:hypothetical protein
MAEMTDPLGGIDEAVDVSPTQVSSAMQPPPLPTSASENKGSSTNSTSVTPSQEEAARALELVMSFFQSQTADFVVEPQDYVAIGKLMEKLRIKRTPENLPSGMRRASEPDFSITKFEAVDALR